MSKTASAARSALNGRIIDGDTNIHSVKISAHDKAEIGYVKQGMETARAAFLKNRLLSKMEITLCLLNGLLIVTICRWGGDLVVGQLGSGWICCGGDVAGVADK